MFTALTLCDFYDIVHTAFELYFAVRMEATMLVKVLVVLILVGASVWVFWRIHLQDKKPWKVYKWALGPLPPPNSSMMQNGLAVESKKDEPSAVVVHVRELQPGDTGWIHVDFVRSFGDHLWLHELGRVTSQVRRHNAGFVEIEVDEEGILVNIGENVRMMTAEEQNASRWYYAMRLVDEDEEDEDLEYEDDEEEEDEGPASS